MRMPSDDQLETAALWLRVNDGDNGEADACAAVAAWLRHEMQERMLRQEARKGGVTVARLRRKLAEHSRHS